MNDIIQVGNLQPKHRKLKKLYNKIRQQMEFYFSDSNLAKDKFLFDLISRDPDGFVEIDVFKKCNKIKALTNNSDIIAESVSRSNLFEISVDRKRIRRVAPLELSKDFDACTLYVENLPPNADRKWIKDVLGQFGSITYINIPRYKVTNRIKGFAFLEFETAEGVKKACEFYKTVPVKESATSEVEDKNVKSAKKHKHEEPVCDKKNKKSRIRSVSESSDKLPNYLPLKHEQNQETSEKSLDPHQKNKRKRKRCSSESEILLKKPKVSTSEVPSITETKVPESETQVTADSKVSCVSKTESDIETLVTADSKVSCVSKTESDIKTGESSVPSEEQITSDKEKVEMSNTIINGTTTDVAKTKRRRKNSKKHRSNSEKPILRVMPKSEWKAYRSKYLNLQRCTMKLFKKQILHEMQEFKEQECNSKPTDVSETKKSLQFMPGIIIKVKLKEPVINPSEIKTQVKANAVVAYVDAPIDNSEIFIRCHNLEDAQNILKEKKLNHLGEAQLIEGEEEKKYWEKIESDRKNKLNNPVMHKKRGRDKLLAKAAKLEELKNKHIYFDE